MKKIPADLENRVVVLLRNNNSIGKVVQITGLSKSTVFSVRKRNNLESSGNCGGRPRVLNDTDARHMERLIRNSSKITPKEASQIINKPTSEWTARRALKKIGMVASVKKKKTSPFKKKHCCTFKILS